MAKAPVKKVVKKVVKKAPVKRKPRVTKPKLVEYKNDIVLRHEMLQKFNKEEKV